MVLPIIDAHIHLDMYKKKSQQAILNELEKYNVEALISVSYHLASCKDNLSLSQKSSRIMPAFGFHPEQELPSENELADLLLFMEKNQEKMAAVGEVGLPYYLRQEQKDISLEPYIDLLEEMIKHAAAFEKPIVLHAVYDDAPIAVDLLEKHSIKKAHFHWFKGDNKTVQRLIRNGYFISFTPDLLYEGEIQEIAKKYPINQVMAETDGPWPFKDIFEGQMTHPKMIRETIKHLAKIKGMTDTETSRIIYENTKQFYW